MSPTYISFDIEIYISLLQVPLLRLLVRDPVLMEDLIQVYPQALELLS